MAGLQSTYHPQTVSNGLGRRREDFVGPCREQGPDLEKPPSAEQHVVHVPYTTHGTEIGLPPQTDPPGTTPGRFSAVLWQSHGASGCWVYPINYLGPV